MRRPIQKEEFFSILFFSINFSCVVFISFMSLDIPQYYTDFISGNTAFSGASKFIDGYVFPVTVLSFFFSIFMSLRLIESEVAPPENSECMSHEVFLLLAFPIALSLSIFFIEGELHRKFISFFGAVSVEFLLFGFLSRSKKNSSLSLVTIGQWLLGSLLFCCIPLSISLVTGRVSITLWNNLHIRNILLIASILYGITFVCGGILVFASNKIFASITNKMTLAGQVAASFLWVALIPASFQSGDNHYGYNITTAYYIVVFFLVLITLADIWKRNRKIEKGLSRYSPFVFISIVVFLRVGSTIVPFLPGDDYHFGEKLIGWWSYFHGILPYVGYFPAHGLIDDDMLGIVSKFFYDGTATSLPDAERLSFAFLSLLCFFSIYHLWKKRIIFAVISTLLLGNRLSFLFMGAVFALWCNGQLRGKETLWISTWIISSIILFLAIPAQGGALIASSIPLGLYIAFRAYKNERKIFMYSMGALFSLLSIILIFTPLWTIITGAINYVLINSNINTEAYGISWKSSWSGQIRSIVTFEFIRMSWVGIILVSGTSMYYLLRQNSSKKDAILALASICIFYFLVMPYMMGRIDPQSFSRPGALSGMGWLVLLPSALFLCVERKFYGIILTVCVCIGGMIFGGNIKLPENQTVMPLIASPQFFNTMDYGIPKGGTGAANGYQIQQLSNLAKVLNEHLAPDESYLDLTSRNAQYFYMNRYPLIPVTAPYNFPSPAQQKNIITSLKKSPPVLCLLEGDNIINDGGGLALRSPYMYKYVINNYIPFFEKGLIFGIPSNSIPINTVPLYVKNLNDKIWSHGYGRNVAATAVHYSPALNIIHPGDLALLPDGSTRTVTKVDSAQSYIVFDRAISPFEEQADPKFRVRISPDRIHEYYNDLYQKSFSIFNYRNLPFSWGKSYKSLKEKMHSFLNIEMKNITLSNIEYSDNIYIVTGKDPFLSIELSPYSFKGESVDFITFDLTFFDSPEQHNMQLFWWGDNPDTAVEKSSIHFSGGKGKYIVPLYASPSWERIQHVKGIRLDFDGPNKHQKFMIKNIQLQYKRDRFMVD